MRHYPDESHIRFATNGGWFDYYYQNNFHNLVTKIPEPEGILPLSSLQNHLAFYEAREFFGLYNGALIVLRAGNSIEKYAIGSTRENRNVNHLYMNHPDLFYKFILYIKEKAFDLIKITQKTPIFPTEKVYAHGLDNSSLDDTLLNNFLNMIDVKSISIVVDIQDVQLPKNEVQL